MMRPPPLAVFLDYGGDLRRFPGVDGLAETVIVRRRLNCPEQNERDRASFAQAVERWLRDGPAALDALLVGCPTSCETNQAVVTAFFWAAECYADPALAERFERAIPPDLFAEQIAWVNERKARA